MAGGYDIYILGGIDPDAHLADLQHWLKLKVLGLQPTDNPAGETQKGQLGGFRHALIYEKTFLIDMVPLNKVEYFTMLQDLRTHLSKPYIFFKRGTYPAEIATFLPENSRIVPTRRTYSHKYNNGQKVLQIECAVYE